MASIAQCLFCFEVLAAHFERRLPRKFEEIEELWTLYERGNGPDAGATRSGKDGSAPSVTDAEARQDEDEYVQPVSGSLRPRELARLQVPSPASVSSSSTPSTLSAASSVSGFGSNVSKASSRTSVSPLPRASPALRPAEDSYPLFVTWNTISSRGHKSLRGCIGTFEAQELAEGLESYALASAFDDTRFAPIAPTELPSLSVSITLLTDFTPCADALDWDLGIHGIRVAFSHHNRRYGATYLPDVAVEQGWTKEETVVTLMRKAGWNGRSGEWRKVSGMHCVRYQGKKASVGYETWRDWRAWSGEGATRTA